ncbi:MAG: YolD-like family protein [Acholeplasmataceae bacterium]|jgi:hypothetical protein|nr:YolD-like family protein [Acholeplasmataceae bacterium]
MLKNLDRGLIKWLPFDALTGFKQAVYELKNKRLKPSKPILSEDQLAIMNYQISTALKFQKSISTYIYKDDSILYVTGSIQKLDMVKRQLKVDNYWYPLDAILSLEISSEFHSYEDMVY